MSSSKPTELRIGAPEAFDGSYDKSTQWLNAVQFYLLVNDKVYDTDNKKIAFTLSYMTKGSALTWATTFRQNAIIGMTITMGTFSNFVTKFETAFKHHDVTGTAIAWLSTKRMTKGKNNTYSPTLIEYVSHFKNYSVLASITNQNVLIGYFSARIPSPLMRRIMSMDTVPSTIDDWYKKAISFQTQWERAEEISKRNSKPAHQSYHSFSTPAKARDPDTMDVDIIKVGKLTAEERKKCMEKGLCFRCRQPGHMSSKCPKYKDGAPKVRQVVEDLPKLEPVDDDEEDENMRKISFSTMDF